MEMEMQKLTVYHYGETPEEDRRVTLSPQMVVAVVAEIEDTTVQGRTVRNVTVLASDGGNLPLSINHEDLEKLESVIGAYSFG